MNVKRFNRMFYLTNGIYRIVVVFFPYHSSQTNLKKHSKNVAEEARKEIAI